MKSKYVIVCIDSDVEVLNTLETKISKIIDSNYTVRTYTTAEEALTNCLLYISQGKEILMTLCSFELSNMNADEFILSLYKHSPYTKNILFDTNLTLECIKNIINNGNINRIIEKNLKQYNLELMILDIIKTYDNERRVRDYQNILEDAVEKRTKDLKETNVKLHILATTDSLTGIKNRRSFFDSSDPMIPYIKREKQPLVILAIDIDKFKAINDTHGHHTGDVVLVEITKSISHILRKSDIFGRIGGEEFAILLPSTSLDGAKLVAEKMRDTIENLKLFSGENLPISVTISIGISDMNHNDNCTEDILLRADEALYKAKNNGRNQVVCG